MTSIAALLASTLNLLIGYTGVFNIAQAAFYGVGGYVTALVSMHWGTSLLLSLVVAVALASVLSVLLALPAGRVTGEYFVVASLAFQVVAYTIYAEWTSVTGGAAGIAGVPRPTVFGYSLDSNVSFLVLAIIMLVLVNLVLYFVIRRTPLGRSLQALRDDATAVQSLGKNPFRLRLYAVVISAGLAASGGVLFAGYVGFVNADTFSVDSSKLFMAMVILGGAGTLAGPIIGAIFISVFPSLVEFIDLASELRGPFEQMVYGLALVALMLLKPEGIAALFSRPTWLGGSRDPDPSDPGDTDAASRGKTAQDEFSPTGGQA